MLGVTLAALKLLDLCRINVKPKRGETEANESLQQRQPHTAQPDDSDMSCASRESFLEGFCAAGLKRGIGH